MTTETSTALIQAITALLTEAYAGPPDPSSTWFIDNEPDSGLIGLLKNVSAKEASTPVGGIGQPGSTIAGNVEHLRWSLASANAQIQNKPFDENWGNSWKLPSADETQWERLRQELRKEFETLNQFIKNQTHLPDEYIIGVLAMVPHAAFHLGVLRQMVERVKEKEK